MGTQEKLVEQEKELVMQWVRDESENLRFRVEAELPPFNGVGWMGKADSHDLA